ncbi:MAG: DEAD/DEAH box helicase [Spirochaetae bacterium HGW-Spirochaetae-2]|jgi:ATP-dependent RNA helicase RhlB|nr:MAG: DEAD/DEAH box helicase [Spirochaetae bacterium HGW-Spirochaetae-2]
MKFKELPLHEEVIKGIESAGFIDCMPVQEKVLPGALQGRDIMAQSKTGSGKTAVFLITLLQKFVDARDEARKLPPEEAFKVKLPVALIIAPTRELAVQIEDDARILSSGIPDFRIGCFYGGVGYAKQDKQVIEGVDLIIGTPGRILDFQQMGKLHFKTVDTFVIDEADRLFDMGFYPDIQKMFKMMVVREQRQTMLFSATLGTRVRNLAWDYMNNPLEIEVQPEEITVNLITQGLYHVAKNEKFDLFLRIMAKENPTNALIFTNTKAKAVEISKRLNVNGYTTQYLMGDLPQSKRLQVINRMKSGELRFLVATDVAARGLQIDDLEFVVNYDIPEDFESYVHRIGRTARAGKSGKAIMLACEQFVYGLEAIESYIQMKIPVLWADEETLPPVEDKSAKMRFRDLVDESEYASRSNSSGPRSRNVSGRGKGAPGARPRSGDSRKPRPSTAKTASAPTERPAPRTATKSAPRAQASGNPVSASRPKPARNDKSYNEIQKMDFEERIAYYKQVYSTEGKPTVASDAPKTSSKPVQKSRPRPQAGVQGDSWEKTQAKSKAKQPSRPQGGAQQAKPQSKPQAKPQARPQAKPQAQPTAVEAAPQKKQGLLARLFKRKKGDA